MRFCEAVLMCMVVSASVSHAVIKELTCCWNPETSALASLQPTSCHTFWASYFLSSSLSLSSCVLGSEVEGEKGKRNDKQISNNSVKCQPSFACTKETRLCIPSCPLPFLCLSIVSGSESSCAGSQDAQKTSAGQGAPGERALNEHPSNATSPIPLHKKCQDTGGEVRSDSALKLLFPEPPVWNKIRNSHRAFYPPQLLGPRPRLNQFKRANRRRRNRQIDGVQRLRKSQLTKHLVNNSIVVVSVVVCPSFWRWRGILWLRMWTDIF